MLGTLQHGDKVSAPENTSALVFNSTVRNWIWICSLKALFVRWEIQENSLIARQANTKQETPPRELERHAGGQAGLLQPSQISQALHEGVSFNYLLHWHR